MWWNNLLSFHTHKTNDDCGQCLGSIIGSSLRLLQCVLSCNLVENEVMELVRQRLPTVQLVPAASEDSMIDNVRTWRNDDDVNVTISRIGDSCINGFGMVVTWQCNHQMSCDLLYVGIVFNNLNLEGSNYEYTIRPIHEVDGFDEDSWDTDDVQPRFQRPGPRTIPK